MPQLTVPEGYSTVSPYLIVEDAARIIEFLEDVFEAVEIRRVAGENGGIRHAEIRLGDSVIMIADAAEGWPSSPAHIHVYVTDVDLAYQDALEAGATSIQVPSQKGDEDRRSGVAGPGGITWWIATRVGTPAD